MILCIANTILLVFVFLRRGLTRADLLLYSYYFAFVFGVPGSYIILNTYNWWVRSVPTEVLYQAHLLYNTTIFVIGVICFLGSSVKLKRRVEIGNENIYIFLFCLVLLTSLVVVVVFLLPNSPLQRLLIFRETDALILADLRGAITSGENIPKFVLYYKNIVIRYLLPYILIYAALIYYSTNRHKLFFFTAAGMAFFTIAIDLSKAPIIKLIVVLMVCKFVVGKLNTKNTFRFSALIVFSLWTLYTFVMGVSPDLVLREILDRIFVVQYVGLPITLDVFPKYHDFLGGFEGEFFSRITMEFANPYGYEQGTSGYLSTFAAAEGYAIAGMSGYIISTVLVVVFLSFLNKFLSKSRSIEWFSFYVLALLQLPFMIMDSASSLILNYGFIFVFLVVSFIEVLIAFLKTESPKMSGLH